MISFSFRTSQELDITAGGGSDYYRTQPRSSFNPTPALVLLAAGVCGISGATGVAVFAFQTQQATF